MLILQLKSGNVVKQQSQLHKTKETLHLSLSCVLKLHPFDMYSLYLCDGNYLLLFIFLVLSCICNWCNSFFFVFSQTYAYIYRYIYFSKENMRERKIKLIRFSLADDQAKWNLHFFLFLSLYFLKNRENVQDRHRSEKSETNDIWLLFFFPRCLCMSVDFTDVCVCVHCLFRFVLFFFFFVCVGWLSSFRSCFSLLYSLLFRSNTVQKFERKIFFRVDVFTFEISC